MDPELQRYLKILVRLASLVLALLALYLLFVYLLPALGRILVLVPVLFLPFIFALILAVLIEPVVNFFEVRLRLGRNLAVFISLFLVVGGLILVLVLVVSKIINELSGLYPLVATYSDQVIKRFVTTISDLKLIYLQMQLPPELQSTLQGNLERGIALLQNLLSGSINLLVQAFAFLPNAAIFLMIATVSTYFMVKDRALLRTVVLMNLPVQARTKTRNVVAELFKALVGFVRAYSILISITGIITMIGLRILGFEYALILGITAGLLDILPILGPGALFLPWIAWEFMNNHTTAGISLLLLYLATSVMRQFLEPKIVGDNIGLHPLATLVSVYVGLQLAGFYGVILGPISVVIFMACYRVGIFDRFNWRKN
ncbi:MAG TPA: sporulation integral membrane protein YtvI [Syntrophomonadaceae bacterium]|nr:sporulation integral membrane protein YtvI [Syntrophomonadaceae bacterium]